MWSEITLIALVLVLLWSLRAEKKLDGKLVFAPSRMFLLGWLVVFVSKASGVIVYQESMHIITFALLLGSITAFMLGVRLANRKLLTDGRTRLVSRSGSDQIFLAVMAIISIAGIVPLLRNIANGTVSRLLTDASTLSFVRIEQWDSFYSGESALSVLDSLGMAGCITLAALLPHFIKQRRPLWSCFSVVCAVAVIVDSLLSAGRFSIGVLVLLLIIGSALARGTRGRQRLFTVPRIAAAVAVAYYFFIIFPVQRNPALPTAVETHLGWAANSYLPDWVKEIAAQDGFSSFSVFAYSTGYFSRALDKLNYFLVHTDVSNWYLLGQYNFPQLSRLFASVSASESGWYEARMDIANLMYEQGWSPNPWATGVRDLVVDFGLLGAVLCAFIFGYVAQRVYISALPKADYMFNVAGAYVSASAFIFAFVGPSQIRLITTSFVLIAVLFALTRQSQRPTTNHRIEGLPQIDHSIGLHDRREQAPP
ncbi:O-antigen polymerase [Mycolicibacterium elephantis]